MLFLSFRVWQIWQVVAGLAGLAKKGRVPGTRGTTRAAALMPRRMCRRPTLCETVANELGRASQRAEDFAIARTKLRAKGVGTQLAWRGVLRLLSR
jgi:hypothetical protein